ncbi:hypothetical protein SAMN04487827_0010 [Prevotella sp. khp7]|nr:hypothetical protein SAMN04487827_0010 [Prevotella sp. khp7]
MTAITCNKSILYPFIGLFFISKYKGSHYFPNRKAFEEKTKNKFRHIKDLL